MPTRKTETKRFTSHSGQSCLEFAELSSRGSEKDTTDAPLVRSPSGSQRRSGVYTAPSRVRVPVMAPNNKPLMPTSPAKARKWVKSGKATPFWNHGVWCVRLNVEPSGYATQRVAVGIDPGSKKEGYSVKAAAHTFLNIQADAVTWVKDHVETRRNMRRTRRYRKTPCRQPRWNRGCLKKPRLAPSTKARWQWKLRVCKWLQRIYPITDFIIEDIAATTKRGRRWNLSFSPLQVGKKWMLGELEKLGNVHIRKGYETAKLREMLQLKKSSNKMAETFEAHAVDSWVLANAIVGGHAEPDFKKLLLITPLRFHRRQLHRLQPAKGGKRKPYGSTRSQGFKRGAIVRHIKKGVAYVGGTLKGRISLHSLQTGKRLCQNAKPTDIKHLTFNSWRARPAG